MMSTHSSRGLSQLELAFKTQCIGGSIIEFDPPEPQPPEAAAASSAHKPLADIRLPGRNVDKKKPRGKGQGSIRASFATGRMR